MSEQSVLHHLQQVYDETEAAAIMVLIREAWTDGILSRRETAVRQLIQDISSHRPIQYILGRTWFYDDIIYLTQPVLIPRPETEELVHWMIRDDDGVSKRIWDIGTGSGCITVTLGRYLPHHTLYASDINPDALENCRYNADEHQLPVTLYAHNVLQDEILPPLSLVQIIVSNPPYIAAAEKKDMGRNVLDHEPGNALFADAEDPLVFYRRIAYIAENICLSTEKVYLELNPLFAAKIISYFNEEIWDFHLKTDMQGKERMLRCQRKAAHL